MKKILIPQQNEMAEYYSDIKNEEGQESTSQLIIRAEYGSDFDGDKLTIDLTDESLKEILEFLKPKLQKDIEHYWAPYF
jgi:hypothetical protein